MLNASLSQCLYVTRTTTTKSSQWSTYTNIVVLVPCICKEEAASEKRAREKDESPSRSPLSPRAKKKNAVHCAYAWSHILVRLLPPQPAVRRACIITSHTYSVRHLPFLSHACCNGIAIVHSIQRIACKRWTENEIRVYALEKCHLRFRVQNANAMA